MIERPITLFTGQWADMPLDELARKAASWGFDGLELACWGNPPHFDVTKALEVTGYISAVQTLLTDDLKCFAISNHLIGQAVCDKIDERHKGILPAHVWGDGESGGVHLRATEEMKNTARAAAALGVSVVNGFTGSPIWPLWYPFPPVTAKMIDAGYKHFANWWFPILQVFKEVDVKFALEVHPTEIAYDLETAQRALEAVGYHPNFGFNFDPSHLLWQGIDPVAFLKEFPEHILHVHLKDVRVQLDGRNGILGAHLPFGHPRRGWDFCSIGYGDVRFKDILIALNQIGYQGPLSIEWEDPAMDREHGAQDSLKRVREMLIPPAETAFDEAFKRPE